MCVVSSVQHQHVTALQWRVPCMHMPSTLACTHVSSGLKILSACRHPQPNTALCNNNLGDARAHANKTGAGG